MRINREKVGEGVQRRDNLRRERIWLCTGDLGEEPRERREEERRERAAQR